MKKLITLLLLFTNPTLQAQQVLVQAPSTTNHELEDFISTSHSKYISYSKYYMDHHPIAKHSKKLELALSKAQHSYLKENLEKSKNYFKELIAMSHIADWKAQQRKTIIYGYLRLAQLEEEKNIKDTWIKKAAYFSMGLPTDEELFPTEILEKYKNYQKISPIYWSPSKKHQNYKYIVINGKRFAHHQKITFTLPQQKIRITFISDSQLSESYILHPKELIRGIKLSKANLVNGSCENHQLHSSLKNKQFTAFFEKPCLIQNASLQEIVQKNTLTNQQNSFNKALSILNKEDFSIFNKKGFTKTKWIWLGAGISVAALLLKSSQNNHKPSIKHGF